jgi:hypothetical protein
LIYDLTKVSDFNNFFNEYLSFINSSKYKSNFEGYYNLTRKQSSCIRNLKVKDIDKILADSSMVNLNKNNDNNHHFIKIQNYIIKKKIGSGGEGIVLFFF